MIIRNEDDLQDTLRKYFNYYHEDRTHLGLDKNTPYGRPVQEKPENGILVSLPRVGGLHHRYERSRIK